MIRNRAVAFMLALCPAFAGTDSKWQYAGESQGISFHLQIRNQCKDGSKVTIKLKSALEHPAVVSFRLNDSDWRKTFTQKLQPGGKEATVSYSPGESPVCHPFIDQIYLEGSEETVTQSTEDEAAAP
jgi:hypothetical protein